MTEDLEILVVKVIDDEQIQVTISKTISSAVWEQVLARVVDAVARVALEEEELN